MSEAVILLLLYVFKAWTGKILPPPSLLHHVTSECDFSKTACSCQLPVATVSESPSGMCSTRRNLNSQSRSKMCVTSNKGNAKKLAPVFCWFEDTFVFFQKFSH